MLLFWFSALFFFVSSSFAAETPGQPSLLPDSLSSLVPADILPNIYCHNGLFYHLPSSQDTTKLFDRFSPAVVSSIMSVEKGKYMDMFIVPILKDYIMPYFLTKKLPSAEDKKSLHALPDLDMVLESTINQILWALYFATGSVQAAEHREMRTVVNAFRNLGFEWKELRSGSGNTGYFTEQRSTRINNMLPVFLTARCFGIDIFKVAEGAKDECAISKEISQGRFPDVLRTVDTLDSQQIFFAVYETYPVSLTDMATMNMSGQHAGMLSGMMTAARSELDIEEFSPTVVLPAETPTRRAMTRPSKAVIRESDAIRQQMAVQKPVDTVIDVAAMIYFPEELAKIQEEINAQQPAPIAWGTDEIDAIIPESIRNHIYLNEENKYFYLPPQDGIKLFDRLGYKTVIEIMKVTGAQHPHLFSVALIQDYILPVALDGRLTAYNLADLPNIHDCLRPFFKRLLWALYFSEGDTQKNQSPLLRTYMNLIKRFGLKWGELRRGCGHTSTLEKQRSSEIPRLLGIYYTARWWNIDVGPMARRTAAESKLSESIFAGVWPKKFFNATFPTSVELFYSVEGQIPRKKIGVTAVRPKLTRPAAPVAKPPAKRRRLNEPEAPTAAIVLGSSDDPVEQPMHVDEKAELPMVLDLTDESSAHRLPAIPSSIPVPQSFPPFVQPRPQYYRPFMTQPMLAFDPYGNVMPVYRENAWAHHQTQTPPSKEDRF